MSKLSNTVNRALLDARAAKAAAGGWPVPKYIEFCRWAMDNGCAVHIYEARKTVSKHITIYPKGARHQDGFKVRFSNHRPINAREMEGDCDVFVGVTNTGTRTTAMAIEAAKKWLDKSFDVATKASLNKCKSCGKVPERQNYGPDGQSIRCDCGAFVFEDTVHQATMKWNSGVYSCQEAGV